MNKSDKVATYLWEQRVKEIDHNLSPESLEQAKKFYIEGFHSGKDNTMTHLKELYEKDQGLFFEIFEMELDLYDDEED